MALDEFFREVNDNATTILNSGFDIEITDTQFVPNFDDPNITFDNLDTSKKKCKRLESCVLYVDIRNSVQMSAGKRANTLAKIYSTFVRSMISCARYYGGHVRGIIGDRVMVVFDASDCFKKSVDTATLMNSVCNHILNKKIKDIDFKCGIGIDYGKMLITKGGAIRHGAEKEFYRSLVWLGKPANIASRLTDVANKSKFHSVPIIRQGNHYPLTKQWVWLDKSYDEFIDDIEPTSSQILKHKDSYFCSFFKNTKHFTTSTNSILITKSVYDGLKKTHPKCNYFVNALLTKKNINVKDYSGDIYGGSFYFKEVDDI